MLSLAKLAALLFAGVNLAHAVALDRRANPAVSVGLDGNVRIIIANREENGQWVESNVHMEWSADTHYFINGLGQDPSVTSQRFTYEAYNQGELFRGQCVLGLYRGDAVSGGGASFPLSPARLYQSEGYSAVNNNVIIICTKL